MASIKEIEKALLSFGKRAGIRIQRRLPDNNAYFNCYVRDKKYMARPWIMLGKKLDAELRLVLLSHELGHFLSIGFYPKGKFHKYFSSMISDQEVYQEEVEAWKFAQVILETSGYQNWPFFNKAKAVRLKDYRELLHIH